MTTKRKILRMIERLDENVTYDRVLYHIEVMQLVEQRLAEADKGPLIEHDEVFARLEEQAKHEDRLDGASGVGLASDTTTNRKKRLTKRGFIPKAV